jgi:hypothetical protein
VSDRQCFSSRFHRSALVRRRDGVLKGLTDRSSAIADIGQRRSEGLQSGGLQPLKALMARTTAYHCCERTLPPYNCRSQITAWMLWHLIRNALLTQMAAAFCAPLQMLCVPLYGGISMFFLIGLFLTLTQLCVTAFCMPQVPHPCEMGRCAQSY